MHIRDNGIYLDKFTHIYMISKVHALGIPVTIEYYTIQFLQLRINMCSLFLSLI